MTRRSCPMPSSTPRCRRSPPTSTRHSSRCRCSPRRRPPPPPSGPAAVPITEGALPAVATTDPALAQPLEPLGSFSTVPLQTVADTAGQDAPTSATPARSAARPLGLTDEFNSLSALREGGGKADNATQISARAREDEGLAKRLMRSLGYYDGTAVSTIETVPNEKNRIRAIVSATPGRLYKLATITVKAGTTVPPDLVRRELPLKVGDLVEAARIQGAEANVALELPPAGLSLRQGGRARHPARRGDGHGRRTLPVVLAPRSSFGRLRTEGDAVFDLDHLGKRSFPASTRGSCTTTASPTTCARHRWRPRSSCRSASNRSAPASPAPTAPNRSTFWCGRPAARRQPDRLARASAPARA
ncbi:hypothetical protein AB5I41_00415 [Sphingomonas sp. MMS24-JH45]